MNDNYKLKRKAAVISLLVGFGMFGGKIFAYLITGSSAIFSDAIESVVHVMATGMALYSILLSSKPADKNHLFGHGNIEYFSAGIEGLLIIIAAITIIYTAVVNIITGSQPEQLSSGTLIIATAGVVNLFLGWYLIKKGKETNSLALEADGKHVLTDSYTSIGVVVGLILVLLTDIYLLDPIVAILVALNIIVSGIKLIRESIGGLMNETDHELLRTIVEKLNEIRKEDWIDLHHLRFWKSAEKVFLDFHLTIPFYRSIRESHIYEQEISDYLNNFLPFIEVRVHWDYCDDILCAFCNLADCSERKNNKSQNLNWSVEKAISGPVNK